MTWKQFLCAMTGHSIITRSQQGQRFFACYACDRQLSRGWDLRDTRHQRSSKTERTDGGHPVVSRVAQVKP
jgi:uncharacterized CHY-type Zn-finger protein